MHNRITPPFQYVESLSAVSSYRVPEPEVAGFRVAFGSGNRVREMKIAGFRIALDYKRRSKTSKGENSCLALKSVRIWEVVSDIKGHFMFRNI